jgi:hypothetical protein
MQPLVIYFDELSGPPHYVTAKSPDEWKSICLNLYSGLRAISSVRESFHMAVAKGQWHMPFHDRPLSYWVENWLGRDKYRWLAARIRQDEATPDLCEVRANDGAPSTGLALAELMNSWTASFALPSTPWANAEIRAFKYELDQNADSSESECVIKNIGMDEHALHWTHGLSDWGRDIADTNHISTVAGNPVDMYPHDHGYPHVHVVRIESPRSTIAKFRIDEFSRMEGPNYLDKEMKQWIEHNRALLLASWNRCKRGEHPYKVPNL